MLHIALDELPRRGTQQMFAGNRGFRDAQRHHVLKLVAKAIGAACLVKRRARPNPARQRLIQQPTVQQNVHRTVRRRHLDRAKRGVPERGNPGKDGVEIGRPVLRDQRLCVGIRRRLAKQEHDFGGRVRLQIDPRLERAAGIGASAHPI